MDFEIERLGPGHWERFRDVRLRALSDSPDAFGSTWEGESRFTPEDWIQRLSRDGVATVVAVCPTHGDIGLAVAAPSDEVMGLYAMWVAPEARREGVGGTLIDAVIAWAKARDFQRVRLDVADSNAGAIALYARKGFHPTGVTGNLAPPRDHILEHQREWRADP